MTCYIVTFDAVGLTPQQLVALRARLKSLGSYCPIHSFSWAILSEKSAVTIRDELLAEFPQARLFVIRSGVEAAWSGAYGPQNSEWLKAHL